jgi:hypothetical protein
MNLTSMPMGELLERDEKGQLTGNMHSVWRDFFQDNLFQMQKNLSQEGFIVPKQTTDNITKIVNNNTIGALVYDKDTNELKVNINGTVKTVQVA